MSEKREKRNFDGSASSSTRRGGREDNAALRRPLSHDKRVDTQQYSHKDIEGGGRYTGNLANGSSARGIIKFKTSFRNTIYDVFKGRGWQQTNDENDWDIMWYDRDVIFEVLDHSHLESWQRVNHYRNNRELCRKHCLIKNLKRHKRQLEKDGRLDEATLYNFYPTTFVLPGDYALFVEEFKKEAGVWIMKPATKAQGKGIFLFTKLSDVSEWKTGSRWDPKGAEVEQYVVQKYITNPLLFGGKKFDLRLYALVPTYNPLKIYVCRTGFCRFTNVPYSKDPADIANSFMHLTNVAVQKHSDQYDNHTGGKWELRSMKLHLMSRYGKEATDKCFSDIQNVMVNTLRSVQKIMMADKHCFQLFGYDIMLDENLKPWLLEVNASPSLTANTAADYRLKCDMLNNMLDIIDLEHKLKGNEKRVGCFDLVYDKGESIPADPLQECSTFLGCEHNSIKVPPESTARPGNAYASTGNSSQISQSLSVESPVRQFNQQGLAARSAMLSGHSGIENTGIDSIQNSVTNSNTVVGKPTSGPTLGGFASTFSSKTESTSSSHSGASSHSNGPASEKHGISSSGAHTLSTRQKVLSPPRLPMTSQRLTVGSCGRP